MRFLKPFILALLASAAVYLALAYLLIPSPISAEYWVREMIVVKTDLLRRAQGKPKVIVASGSGTLFGFDAAQATALLGRPVINFGLHAGLKLETMLRLIEPAAERGDAVVLPLEPGYYSGNEENAGWQIRNAVAWNHADFERLNVFGKMKFLTGISPAMLGEMLYACALKAGHPQSVAARQGALDDEAILARFKTHQPFGSFAYSAYHLNDFGDMPGTSGSRLTSSERLNPELPARIIPEVFALLAEFKSKLEAKGVALYFANCPYVADPAWSRPAMQRAEDQFVKQLAPLGIMLGNRAENIYPTNYFFDTCLHLNTEGKQLRTARLVKALGEQLGTATK